LEVVSRGPSALFGRISALDVEHSRV
jgi:hypothetical protein